MLPLVWLGACAAPEVPSGPVPVILVSLDTFRADRIGAIAGGPSTLTPNLDRFAGESVTFTRAYSQAASTALSHGSLFTSRDPLELPGKGDRVKLGGAIPTLAGVLAAYGWDSAGFVAGGEMAPAHGVGEGFGTWESAGRDFASLWHTIPPTLAWLDARKDDPDPFLLLVHGYDTHTRYLKPGPWGHAQTDPAYAGPMRGIAWDATDLVVDGAFQPSDADLLRTFAEAAHPHGAPARPLAPPGAIPLALEDLAHLEQLQDGAVRWADTMFGLLLAELEGRGWLERAVIVVFADHGEQLGEAGIFNHCCGAGDPEVHVPLLVRMPGGASGGRRVDALVELTDVMPTLLALAGVKPPAIQRGRSLLPALRGEPFEGRPWAFSVAGPGERIASVRGASGRLVWTGPSLRDPEARELLRVARLPGPSFSWVGEGSAPPAARAALLERLDAEVLSGAQMPGTPSDPAHQEALRQRGYWNLP